jgi:hypothetical protein
MFAYELCLPGCKPGEILQATNYGKGILKEILHLVKWKHLQNSGQFVANFMNILKEFRPYSVPEISDKMATACKLIYI